MYSDAGLLSTYGVARVAVKVSRQYTGLLNKAPRDNLTYARSRKKDVSLEMNKNATQPP